MARSPAGQASLAHLENSPEPSVRAWSRRSAAAARVPAPRTASIHRRKQSLLSAKVSLRLPLLFSVNCRLWKKRARKSRGRTRNSTPKQRVHRRRTKRPTNFAFPWPGREWNLERFASQQDTAAALCQILRPTEVRRREKPIPSARKPQTAINRQSNQDSPFSPAYIRKQNPTSMEVTQHTGTQSRRLKVTKRSLIS